MGVVGYEINFNRHFYRYTPPRPLEDIERDIQAVEADIVRMLGEVTGSRQLAPTTDLSTLGDVDSRLAETASD